MSIAIAFFPSCKGFGDIENGFYVAKEDENVYLVVKNKKMTIYTYGVEKVYTYEVDNDNLLLTDEDGECEEYEFSYYESSEVLKLDDIEYKKQRKEPSTYNIKGSFYMESNSSVQVSFDDEKMTYTKADGTVDSFYFQIHMKSDIDKYPWLYLYENKEHTGYSHLLRVEFVGDDMILHYSYYNQKADEKFIRK